jgi:hypothetical protein
MRFLILSLGCRSRRTASIYAIIAIARTYYLAAMSISLNALKKIILRYYLAIAVLFIAKLRLR